MTGNPCWQAIPTKLSEAQFEEFVLPHLSRGRRGPAPTLSLHKIFNYILQILYMGCQWKMLPIERNAKGLPEIHHTRIYRMMRRWQADGSIDRIFAGTVHKLHQDQILELSVIHGDGTTTAAKKGGDNLGYSGHKHLKGCKVVAFCDRDCNIIAPFVTAPGNRRLTEMVRAIGADVLGTLFVVRGCMSRFRWQLPASCDQYHGKRDGLSIFGDGIPQGLLMAVREQERGLSESRPVTGRIGVATLSHAKAGRLPLWSRFTREFLEPTQRKESK